MRKKKNVFAFWLIILHFRCAGDAYFFKDNLYWVLKSGGLNQEVVTAKSIAVDWLRCPAPAPRNPGDCSCDLNRSGTSFLRGSWLLLISLTLITIIGK